MTRDRAEDGGGRRWHWDGGQRRRPAPRLPPTEAPPLASRAFHPFLAAAGTDFGGEELALLDVEAAPGQDLPFVEARAAERLVVGANAAGGLEGDDVGHGPMFKI